jgi:hypothetical protein
MPEHRRNPNCEIEYAASWSDQGLPCGKSAVAECADCGKAICEGCRMECCGPVAVRKQGSGMGEPAALVGGGRGKGRAVAEAQR